MSWEEFIEYSFCLAFKISVTWSHTSAPMSFLLLIYKMCSLICSPLKANVRSSLSHSEIWLGLYRQYTMLFPKHFKWDTVNFKFWKIIWQQYIIFGRKYNWYQNCGMKCCNGEAEQGKASQNTFPVSDLGVGTWDVS